MTRFLPLGLILTFAACGSDSKEDTGYESILGDRITSNGDDGSNDTGGAQAAPADNDEPRQDSCEFVGYDICYETNEPDNEAWCAAVEATYDIPTIYRADEGCGEANVICDIPAGGDFSAAAVAYMDDYEICTNAGGTVR